MLICVLDVVSLLPINPKKILNFTEKIHLYCKIVYLLYSSCSSIWWVTHHLSVWVTCAWSCELYVPFQDASITFHNKLTLEKVSQSCRLLQQVKVMYPALAYCSPLIALCSSWPIDFMVSRGLLRLIRMDSHVFAFWRPFSRRLCNCEKPL